jgi:hypothetical protein
MGRHGHRLARRPALSAVSAVSMFLAVALAGCSAAPAAKPAAPAPATAHSPGAASATPEAGGTAPAVTIAGDHPVPGSGSQDTHAQTPGASCDSTTFATDKALGGKIATGFSSSGFPVPAALLTHFLQGTGAAVDYRAGSVISQQARASTAFRAVDSEVQSAILSQLKAGRARVRLSAGQLPTVTFASSGGDLYWGFRGTQGLTVTGSAHRANGRYTGTLSYVIRDSYGFPAGDTLAGFGAPMRYLQTVCGAPGHAGGAHWFPDTITVNVPFSHSV